MTNAITLSDTMYFTGVVIGPAVGAVVYSLFGPGWCFFLNGVSFIAVIVALLMMQIQSMPALSRRGSGTMAVMEGFRYVRGNHQVQTLTIGELLLSIMGYGPLILLPA